MKQTSNRRWLEWVGGLSLLLVASVGCSHDDSRDEFREPNISFIVQPFSAGDGSDSIEVFLTQPDGLVTFLGVVVPPARIEVPPTAGNRSGSSNISLRPRGVRGGGSRFQETVYPLDYLLSNPAPAIALPLEVEINDGVFDGRTIPISDEASFGLAPGGMAFISGSHLNWTNSSFPIPLAFRRAGLWTGGCRVFLAPALPSSGDSIFFWEQVEALEDRVGLDLFRPESLDHLAPEKTRKKCGVTEVYPPTWVVTLQFLERPTHGDGLPSAWTTTWRSAPDTNAHEIDGGTRRSSLVQVRFLLPAKVPDSRPEPWIIQHELLHVLGLDHTCAFPSIMNPISPPPGGLECQFLLPMDSTGKAEATEYDVAYVQLIRQLVIGETPGTFDSW